MNEKRLSLADLPIGKKAKIVSLLPGRGRGYCRGYHGRHRFYAMGLIEGQLVEVISKQPLFGPITISLENGNCKLTIGRGMASRIIVELI